MAIWDQFAGNPTQPILIAQAIDISPTSSNWRYITGAAVAYGLTDGGYNAQTISLTELGKRIVAPITEGDDKLAIIEAVQSLHILINSILLMERVINFLLKQ